MSDSSVRLFLATPLDEAAHDVLHGFYTQRDTFSDLRHLKANWVSPANWHLTWHFIGNTPKASLPALMQTLSTALDGAMETAVLFESITLWPNHRRPNLLVWLGQPEDDALNHNIIRIRSCFPEFSEEERFTPHITLARFKPMPKEKRSLPPPKTIQLPQTGLPPTHRWPIRKICLYQSTLTPQGAVYECLFTWPLMPR
jgi:RNA 2',3'-cyclic 3'-phosphodiesterase